MIKKGIIISALSIPAALLTGWVGIWLWILASSEPISRSLATLPLWPVACSTRGCVSSAAWQQQHQFAIGFAQATEQDIPPLEESLTTAIRQHMVSNAFLRSPVTLADARRYRENVLRITQESQIEGIIDAPFPVYDERVILPFLQQEALLQQHGLESTEELYKKISQERFILLLPFSFSWDKAKGEAVMRN